jgi:enoyl-CoA hydratase/carnithine racemase
MANRYVVLTKKDGTATVTLNRPERLNALNFNVIEQIVRAFEECEHDSAVRVVVLTGAGRAFCAGDDLKGMMPEEPLLVPVSEDGVRQRYEGYPRAVMTIRNLPKPVIARVNGHAHGAGCELCLACDFRIAAETATFAEPYVLRGLASGVVLLPRYIGLGRATQMLLTGEPISAQEAERFGMVNKVVPLAELDGAVDELAAKLAKAATRAIGLAKRSLNQALGAGIEQGYMYQSYASYLANLSEDVVEGKKAFAEKREPKFKGK